MRDTLKTGRLVLRPLRISDAAAFSKAASNPAIANMTSGFPAPFLTLAAEMKILIWLCDVKAGRAYRYAIESKEASAFVGMIAVSKTKGIWSLSYWLAEDFWGLGFATEAAKCVIGEAETTLTSTLYAGTFRDNTPSQNLLLKLGFKRQSPSSHEDRKVFSASRKANVPHVMFCRDMAFSGGQHA